MSISLPDAAWRAEMKSVERRPTSARLLVSVVAARLF